MAYNKKNLFPPDAVLYIIGKYTHDPTENPQVIRVTVTKGLDHGKNVAMDVSGGRWLITKKYLGRAVFETEETARKSLEGRSDG